MFTKFLTFRVKMDGGDLKVIRRGCRDRFQDRRDSPAVTLVAPFVGDDCCGGERGGGPVSVIDFTAYGAPVAPMYATVLPSS